MLLTLRSISHFISIPFQAIDFNLTSLANAFDLPGLR